MLDWLIVGGGMQGTTLATYLLKRGHTCHERLKVIDPFPAPLEKWNRMTTAIHMPYLRSPAVHHIDVDPFSLLKFAQSPAGRWVADFTFPQQRPGLELFQEHCRHVLSETALSRCWVHGRVRQLNRLPDGWKVSLSTGDTIGARRVVLALGLSERPYWPEWSRIVRDQGCAIFHVFTEPIPSWQALSSPVTIIGGGITAAHLAIHLARHFPGQVHLFSRHPLRIHQFDSDPGWLGPKNMNRFRHISDANQRRAIIVKARHRGSMPSDIHAALMQQVSTNGLVIGENEVESIRGDENEMSLVMADGSTKYTRSVILATGFDPSPPGFDWLQPTIDEEGLRCADCGYPLISPSTLEWAPGLFVVGALAELELGPVARNIAGARRGAERILRHLEQRAG